MINKNRILPFSLSLFVLLADQITKLLVVEMIPVNSIKMSFFGDFLRIVHLRNTAIAFSMGDSIPGNIKIILFSFIPLAVLILVTIYIIKNNEISQFQRWLICGIIGGGLGNLIDRFFRPAGVIDFIDVKFYGIFGLDRWPTFNTADSAIVVCGILLLLSFLLTKDKTASK